MVFALYINSDQVKLLYERPILLWLICPVLLFWISRIWLFAQRGRIHDDPIVFALKDKASYWCGAATALILRVATGGWL